MTAPGGHPGRAGVGVTSLSVGTMKFTAYFLRNRHRPDRKMIQEEWIRRAAEEPVHEVVQADGRIRRWTRIDEAGGRFLRVVLLEDGKTVHNAFFDRRFKEVDDAS